MDMGIFLVVFLYCALPVVLGCGVGVLIGRPRGQTRAGFWLGLLGPIGWIITAFLPRSPEAEARYQRAVQRALAESERVPTNRPNRR